MSLMCPIRCPLFVVAGSGAPQQAEEPVACKGLAARVALDGEVAEQGESAPCGCLDAHGLEFRGEGGEEVARLLWGGVELVEEGRGVVVGRGGRVGVVRTILSRPRLCRHFSHGAVELADVACSERCGVVIGRSEIAGLPRAGSIDQVEGLQVALAVWWEGRGEEGGGERGKEGEG